MICLPCKSTPPKHEECPGETWCDCQHVTEGVNINPDLVPVRPVIRAGSSETA